MRCIHLLNIGSARGRWVPAVRCLAAILLAAVAVVLAPRSSLADDDDLRGSKVRFMGKLVAPKRSADASPPAGDSAKTLRVKTAKGEYSVGCSGKTTFVVHETLALKDIPSEAGAWILALRQAATRTENNGTFPPQIIKVNAVVLADSAGAYQPPPVPEELKKQRVEWMYGKLKNNTTGFSFKAGDGDTNVQTGPDRQVIRIKKGSVDDMTANEIVFVSGSPPPDAASDNEAQPDVPDVVADTVTRLASNVSAKDYAMIVGQQIAPAKRPKKR